MANNNNDHVVQVLKEHVYREYEALENVTNWKTMPEIPTAEEIIGKCSRSSKSNSSEDDESEELERAPRGLPINIIAGPWENVESYVRSHYKLLREDAIAPLRKAVALFKKQPAISDNDDVSIYTHVRAYLDVKNLY
jgi:helicase required for RNAi-mediated heterochromatin assembly 1